MIGSTFLIELGFAILQGETIPESIQIAQDHTKTIFREAVLMAVNLGDGTDTVGAITGGLAGMFYGQNLIPKEWIDVLVRKEDILALIDSFEKSISRSIGLKN